MPLLPSRGIRTRKLEEQVRAAEARFGDHWARGPTRLRWTALPVQIGDPAPDAALKDAAGRTVRLSDFWADGPALLLFWRHYGCGCGIDRAARLQKEHGGYAEAGATVLVIGQGEPERATAYTAKYGIPCAVLCDPTHGTYEAYGLLEGGPAHVLFDAPEALQRREPTASRAFAAARREAGRPLVDNPWLLPGEFVVDPAGVVRLAYRYNYCEDFPDPRVLVTAIREAAGGP